MRFNFLRFTLPLFLALISLVSYTSAIEARATYRSYSYKPSTYTYSYTSYKPASTYTYSYTRPKSYSYYGGYHSYSYYGGYHSYSGGGVVYVGGGGGGLCCLVFIIICCVACCRSKNSGDDFETVTVTQHNPAVVEHHTVTVVDNGMTV